MTPREWLEKGAALIVAGIVCIVVGVLLALLQPPVPPEPPITGDTGGYRPHYVGFGAKTPGGRGGGLRIGRLSKLQPSGYASWDNCVAGGSLLDCMATPPGCDPATGTAQQCARIIVCETSGVMHGRPMD